MNSPNSGDNDCVCIGGFDADELKDINSNPKAKKMIKEGRVGLEYAGHDKGAVWIRKSDTKAFALFINLVY